MGMNFEMSRIYREIMEDVSSAMERETDMDYPLILDIKRSWAENLKKILDSNETQYMDEIEYNDSDISEEDDIKYKNYMMCLYDKVSKTKNKWKCSFKRGFLNIGNRDYVFLVGYGDLEW